MMNGNGYSLDEIEQELKRRDLKESMKNYSSHSLMNQNQLDQPMNNNPEIGRLMSAITGFNTGVERFAMGPQQILAGLIGPKARKFVETGIQRRERGYEQAHKAHPGYAGLGEVLGQVGVGLPFFEVGGALAAKHLPKLGKLGQQTIGSGLGGGTMGGLQSVNPDESRMSNITAGGLIGSAFPVIGRAAQSIGSGITGAVTSLAKNLGIDAPIIKEMLYQYTPEEMLKALKNLQLAKALGVHLTPAEASGSKIGAKFEGKLGTSPQGERAYHNYKTGQKQAQEKSIEDLSKRISPTSENASEELRSSAKNIIYKKEKELQEKARPFYESSYSDMVSPNRINSLIKKDGNIDKSFNEVINSNLYRKELQNYPLNSIKTLDLVKRNLDDKISVALRKGQKDKARILTESKNSLVKSMDKISDNYKNARSIYADDSPAIDAIRNAEIGKIAKLSDLQIKKAANVIFDPSQTDPRVLSKIRDELSKENPEAWRRIVRNQMENKISTSYRGTTGYHGTNFYRQILANEKTFNQFKSALKGDRKSLYRLEAMRNVFKDLINEPTVKSAAALSKSSLDVNRNTLDAAKKFAQNLTGGNYDQAAINIITSNKWQKAMIKALQEKTESKKKKAMMDVLNKAKAGSVKSVTPLAVTQATETSGTPINIDVPLYYRNQ